MLQTLRNSPCLQGEYFNNSQQIIESKPIMDKKLLSWLPTLLVAYVKFVHLAYFLQRKPVSFQNVN